MKEVGIKNSHRMFRLYDVWFQSSFWEGLMTGDAFDNQVDLSAFDSANNESGMHLGKHPEQSNKKSL